MVMKAVEILYYKIYEPRVPNGRIQRVGILVDLAE
jgi:hypothetical protein